jgi:hypothetical protein
MFNQYFKDHPNSSNKTTTQRWKENFTQFHPPKPPPKPLPKPTQNIFGTAIHMATDVSNRMHNSVNSLLQKVNQQLNNERPTHKSQGKQVDVNESLESVLMGNKADFIQNLEEQKKIRNGQGKVNKSLNIEGLDLDSYLGTNKATNELDSFL